MDFGEERQGIMNYISGLNGLRAIAILAVVLYHLFPGTVQGGFLGVSLFFILSGYLITVTTVHTWNEGKFDLWTFYKKRIRRLYPSMLIVVFVTIFLMTFLAPNSLRGIRREFLSIVGGYNNWWQIKENLSYFTRFTNQSPFTHIWSLAIEFQFYLIWPALLWVYQYCKKKQHPRIAMLGIAVLILASALEMTLIFRPGADPSRVYYGTDTRMFSIFMGVLMGLVQSEQQETSHSDGKKDLLTAAFFLLMGGAVASFLFINGQKEITYEYLMFVTSLLYAALLAIVIEPNLPVGKWLEHPWLSWLGERSYELYLVQYPVTFFFRHYLVDASLPISVFSQILLSVVLADQLYRCTKGFSFAAVKEFIMNQNVSKIKKGILAVMAVVILGVSGCSMMKAPADKLTADQKQLQEELKQNQEMLQETQTPNPTETPATPSPDAKPEATHQPAATPVPEQPTHTPESTTTPVPATPAPQPETPAATVDITMIGDSVMLGAAPSLKNSIPNCVVDAVESRQVWSALKVIKALESNGQLGKTVIIALGTNGTFKVSTGEEILNYLGPDRTVYWVNAYGKTLKWQNDVNSLISQVAGEYSNVTVLDWAATAPEHPEWFYDDGIHLNAEGQVGYAGFIQSSIS